MISKQAMFTFAIKRHYIYEKNDRIYPGLPYFLEPICTEQWHQNARH
jgi:hypothetical protein